MKYSHPGIANIIERNGSLEGIFIAGTAFRIIRIPVYACFGVGHQTHISEQLNSTIAYACVIDVRRYIAAGGHAARASLAAYKAVAERRCVVAALKRLVQQIAHGGHVVVEVAAVAQHALPQLHANYAEYKENKKT